MTANPIEVFSHVVLYASKYPATHFRTGVFTDDLGFTRCLIDDVVGQIGHKRFGIFAVDRSHISTMRGRFNGLYAG